MSLPKHEQFLACAGQVFVVGVGNGKKVSLKLAEVSACRPRHQQPENAVIETFSISFDGIDGDYLPQATYRFSHADLGEFDLFIVPIAQDKLSKIFQYQAVFN